MPSYRDQNPLYHKDAKFIEAKKTFIRLVNFFLAKIETSPLYSVEIEAFLSNMEQKLGKDAVLTEIVTFEYYLCCQNQNHILEKLKDTLNDLTINLITIDGYSIEMVLTKMVTEMALN